MRVGITDYAQDALGDVVFVQLPDVGTVVEAGGLPERGGVDQVGVRRLRACGRHGGRGQRRADRRARSRSTRIRTARAGSAPSSRPTPPPTRPPRRRRLPAADRRVTKVVPAGRRPARTSETAAIGPRRGEPRSALTRALALGIVFCNQCGHRNPSGRDSARRAAPCIEPESGEETTITFAPVDATGEIVEDELTVRSPRSAEATAMVVVKRGPNAGAKFVLDADVTRAGRHPDSDIFLDDITVSRRHAEIVRGGRRLRRPRRRLAERHLPQPRAHRRGAAGQRRRAPDRQVPPGLLRRRPEAEE